MAALLTPANTPAASIAAVAIGGSPPRLQPARSLPAAPTREHRVYCEKQIRHGAILLWVRAPIPEGSGLRSKSRGNIRGTTTMSMAGACSHRWLAAQAPASSSTQSRNAAILGCSDVSGG